MYNNLNDITGKWAIQNMDEAHFYMMSTWSDQKGIRPLKRILLSVRKALIILQCHINALNPPPELAMNKQGECIEA